MLEGDKLRAASFFPMACKKSELIATINSYVAARLTGDNPLITAAASMLQNILDSIDYEPEADEQGVDEAEAE